MSDDFVVKFDGAAEYAPFVGGGSELLPFDGLFEAVIQDVELGESRSGNKTFELKLLVQDADAKGMRINKAIPVTGMRKDNKPNVVGLFDALHSVYTGTEGSSEKATAKVQALQGQESSAQKLKEALKGRTLWIRTEARQYENKQGQLAWVSSAEGYVTKQEYEAQKPLGAHRRPLPAAAQAWKTSRGAAAANTNGTNGTHAATTAAPAAANGGVDPLALVNV